jgi:IclR family transcriptional regulator, acetate operon repressor
VAGVNAAERLLDIVELLVDHPDGVPLSEIARRLRLAKSATHRLLTTLVERGYVEQPPGREQYRLSLKLSALGFRYVSQTGLLDICQPVLDRLAVETGELVRMALADGQGLTWVAKSQGARFGLRYDPDMGSPVVLHATASGRAWLVTLPEAEAVEYVEAHGFDVPDRFGRQKVKSIADLAKELKTTASRGYALAVEEGEPGAAAVALAIPMRGGKRSPGTLSVAGPVVRMSSQALTEIVPKLSAVVAEIGDLWPILQVTGASAVR